MCAGKTTGHSNSWEDVKLAALPSLDFFLFHRDLLYLLADFSMWGSRLGHLLLSPSSLCLPLDRPINRRRGVEARKTTLLGKPADQKMPD